MDEVRGESVTVVDAPSRIVEEGGKSRFYYCIPHAVDICPREDPKVLRPTLATLNESIKIRSRRPKAGQIAYRRPILEHAAVRRREV